MSARNFFRGISSSICKGKGHPYLFSGFTLVELFIAVAVVGLLAVPIARFTGSILKGFVTLNARKINEDFTIKSVVDIERDFKDMNEVRYLSETRIQFIMDSHRLPGYFTSKGVPGLESLDPDKDKIPNRDDPDDDGDAFDSLRNAADFLLLPDAISSNGWRQGLDLQDDDDDNDGYRDVICEYEYDKAGLVLTRRFKYNNQEWTLPSAVVSNVVAFRFIPYGSPFISDPNTNSPPTLADANGDGVFDFSELNLSGGDLLLDTFEETKYVSSVGYTMTVQPNLKRPETYELNSTVKPVLMAIKEKFE